MGQRVQQRLLCPRQQLTAGQLRLQALSQHQHVHKVTNRPGESSPATAEHRRDNRRVFLSGVASEQDLQRAQADGIQGRALGPRKLLEAASQVLVDVEGMPGIVARLDRYLRPVVQHVIIRQLTGQLRFPVLAQAAPLFPFQDRPMPLDEFPVWCGTVLRFRRMLG